MTVSIGGIALSEHLILSGIETAPDIVVNPRRLMGGELDIQTDPISGGRELSLSGDNHFTLAQITAIKVLAGQGQAVELVHPRGTFNILIKGTPVEPSRAFSDPVGEDMYSGEITGIEI